MAKAHQGLILQQLVILFEPLNLLLLVNHDLLALQLAELRHLEPGLFLKVDRDRANLVSEAERRRTVIKNIAQV